MQSTSSDALKVFSRERSSADAALRYGFGLLLRSQFRLSPYIRTQTAKRKVDTLIKVHSIPKLSHRLPYQLNYNMAFNFPSISFVASLPQRALNSPVSPRMSSPSLSASSANSPRIGSVSSRSFLTGSTQIFTELPEESSPDFQSLLSGERFLLPCSPHGTHRYIRFFPADNPKVCISAGRKT